MLKQEEQICAEIFECCTSCGTELQRNYCSGCRVWRIDVIVTVSVPEFSVFYDSLLGEEFSVDV